MTKATDVYSSNKGLGSSETKAARDHLISLSPMGDVVAEGIPLGTRSRLWKILKY